MLINLFMNDKYRDFIFRKLFWGFISFSIKKSIVIKLGFSSCVYKIDKRKMRSFYWNKIKRVIKKQIREHFTVKWLVTLKY